MRCPKCRRLMVREVDGWGCFGVAGCGKWVDAPPEPVCAVPPKEVAPPQSQARKRAALTRRTISLEVERFIERHVVDIARLRGQGASYERISSVMAASHGKQVSGFSYRKYFPALAAELQLLFEVKQGRKGRPKEVSHG